MQKTEMHFHIYKYKQCPKDVLHNLYELRYQTFKERLDWSVSYSGRTEFDEYDNENTTYIVGELYGTIICSVRFICISYPNMITGTFREYFDLESIKNKSNYVESSRFFVDKQKVQTFKVKNVANLLFIKMFDYAFSSKYSSIFTIVSESMLRILKRAGWNYEVFQSAQYDIDEKIYLLKLSLDNESRVNLLRN